MQELLTSEECRDINRRLDIILNDKHKTYEVLEVVCSWLYDEDILRNKGDGLNRNLAIYLQNARDEIYEMRKGIRKVESKIDDNPSEEGEEIREIIKEFL